MTDNVPVDANKFTALHVALVTGGTVLYVPRNLQIELPLHGVTGLSGGRADFSHTLVIAEENSQVTYVDDLISSDGEAAFHSGVVEIFAQPGAVVRYLHYQDWNVNTWHFLIGPSAAPSSSPAFPARSRRHPGTRATLGVRHILHGHQYRINHGPEHFVFYPAPTSVFAAIFATPPRSSL